MDAGWFAPIRAYCERTDASFWAEPLNALSNGAFLIAAAAAAAREREGPIRDVAVLGLVGLVAVVGIGSFLFHTFANRWSMLADIVPIGLFIYAYFWLAMRRFFGLPMLVAAAVTLLFAGFNFGLAPTLDAVAGSSSRAYTNGSVEYLPAALALFGVGAGLLLRGSGPAYREAGSSILKIGALFLLSLTLRTIDVAICPSLPVGTHYLWHLLNAAVLYGLIAVTIQFAESTSNAV